MRKICRTLIALFLLPFLWSGCVSQQSFQSVVQQLERERIKTEQLRQEIEGLRAEAVKLQEEAALVSGGDAASAKKLAQNKARISKLSAKVKSQTKEITALKKKTAPKIVKGPDMSWAKGVSDPFQRAFRNEIKNGTVQIKKGTDRLVVTLAESLIFDPDDVEITLNGEDFLARLGQVLKGIKGRQMVIGAHLDNVPIAPALAREFPTAWEFTGMRAIEILRFLEEESQVSAKLLSATAYGSARTIASNSTESGRAKNRRVELTFPASSAK